MTVKEKLEQLGCTGVSVWEHPKYSEVDFDYNNQSYTISLMGIPEDNKLTAESLAETATLYCPFCGDEVIGEDRDRMFCGKCNENIG